MESDDNEFIPAQNKKTDLLIELSDLSDDEKSNNNNKSAGNANEKADATAFSNFEDDDSSEGASKKSSYHGFHEMFDVRSDGLMDHDPLVEINDLDIIDNNVIKNKMFESVEINFKELKETLKYYNRIPGRVKIDKPWQVAAMLGLKEVLFDCYYALEVEEKTDAFGQHAGHFLALAGYIEELDLITKLEGCKLRSRKEKTPSQDEDNPEGRSGYNKAGCNAMGYAAIAGKVDMMKHLELKHKLSPQEFHDNYGNRLLQYFGKGGHSELILDYEDGTIEVEDESEDNPDSAYDIDHENKNGCKPLHELLLNGHLAAFKVCCNEFGLENYGSTEITGMNFCHLAAASGRLDAVKYTLQTFKSQRQEEDANGAKLGLLGVRSGNKEVIQYLASKGYGIDSTDDRGYGAIEYAIAYDQTHIIAGLVKDYGLASKINKLQCAAENGQIHSFKRVMVLFEGDKDVNVWSRVDNPIGKLYPIQFAKNNNVRGHIATIMVDKLLNKKNPFGTRHKLGEWKGNVRETVTAYQEKIGTGASWISTEQIESFKKRIKHMDKKGKSKNDSEEIGDAQDRDPPLLKAIRKEMIKTLIIRAEKDFDRRAATRSIRKDFIGNYMRTLHACYQIVNPDMILSEADKHVPTVKEIAIEKTNEAKVYATQKVTELRGKIDESSPRFSSFLNLVASKLSKPKTGANPLTQMVDDEEQYESFDGSHSN